jgi:hypothetical protein
MVGSPARHLASARFFLIDAVPLTVVARGAPSETHSRLAPRRWYLWLEGDWLEGDPAE